MTDTTLTAEWQKAIAEFEAAEQAYASRDASATDDEIEAMGDRIADAAGVLIRMPAPSPAALKWKLRYLTGEAGGWCWSPEYYRQTVEDIARHLPDDDSDEIRANWEAAVAELERCEILDRAAQKIGPMPAAIAELALLEESRAEASEIRKAWQKVRELEDAQKDAYFVPLWRAQQRVALTPAPDLAAIKFKVELIVDADLTNDDEMPDDLLGLIHADVERLGTKAGPAVRALSGALIEA